MYLTRNEIIVTTTLFAYLLFSGLMSVIVFIAGFIYLLFINKKMRYHLIRNDSQDALMLEGGTNHRKTQMVKLGAILLLWAVIWYFKGFGQASDGSIVQDIIAFWVFISQITCAILTVNIGYKMFDTSVNSEAYTKRELMVAGSLLIELSAGIYYFYHWFSFGDHQNILDANMNPVILNVIIFSIVAASALAIIVNKNQTEEAKDERDMAIEVKAYRYGFYALSSLISLLIGQLIMDNTAQSLWGDRALNLNTVEIANLLLMSVIIAWSLVSAAKLFFYRRGY